MTLYLVRHGESQANRTGCFAGQTDIPLTDCGCAQAQRVAEFFRTVPLEAVYASGLSRAVDTARPTADSHGLPVISVPELREIYAGEWEGLPFEELPRRFPADYRVWKEDIGAVRCTGGESMAEVAARAGAALQAIAQSHPHGPVAVVSHGGVLRAVLTLWATGSTAAMQLQPWMPNASVTEVQAENGTFRVVRHGMVGHLAGLVTRLPNTV